MVSGILALELVRVRLFRLFFHGAAAKATAGFLRFWFRFKGGKVNLINGWKQYEWHVNKWSTPAKQSTSTYLEQWLRCGYFFLSPTNMVFFCEEESDEENKMLTNKHFSNNNHRTRKMQTFQFLRMLMLPQNHCYYQVYIVWQSDTHNISRSLRHNIELRNRPGQPIA